MVWGGGHLLSQDPLLTGSAPDVFSYTAGGTLHENFSLCSVVAVYTAQSTQPICNLTLQVTSATLHILSTNAGQNPNGYSF